MGRVTKVFASGSIGNAIFYERLGTACVRSMPSQVRQTNATKEVGKIFGRSKSISKQLREGLSSILLHPKARQVMYTTDTALYGWLRTGDTNITGSLPPPLVNLNFNSKTSFYERFKKQLVVDWSNAGKVVINIPSFDPTQTIAAPIHTATIQLMLAVTACTLNGKPVNGSNATLDIEYRQGNIPAQDIELPLEESANTIYLVVAALRYYTFNKGIKEMVQGEQWLPVSGLSGYLNG